MTTPGGVIQSLSASQAEEFDPEQVGGCPRRWYYHRVERVALPDPERSKIDGDFGHAHFAHYYRTGQRPRRAKMAKAVNGALDAGHLPPREPGQLIESRFDGQPARDANGERVPLRHDTTLWLGAMPWDGYVDLRFYRAGTITVLDHKFSSDIHTYAKSDLLATVQMPVYALDSLRIWPDAQHVELIHHYVSRRGVDSFIRRQLVTVEQVRQRGEEIAKLAREIWKTSLIENADDVPANKKSCHTWSGCPFQSRCSAFKEKPKMNLSDEELSWLNVVGGGNDVVKELAGTDPAVLAAAVEGLKPEDKEKLGEIVEKLTPGALAVAEATGRMDDARGKASVSGTDAAHASQLEIASAAGALDPDEFEHHGRGGAMQPADEDPFAVFAPVASVPQEQPAPPPVETAKPAEVTKCPDCPHPPHQGAACTGKRGRGACRCGAQGPVEKAQDAAALAGGHLGVCVQDDAGKWLCMEGCQSQKEGAPFVMDRRAADPNATGLTTSGASSALGVAAPESDALIREREMHRRTLGELDAVHRELERLRGLEQRVGGAGPGVAETVALYQRAGLSSAGWTGTLQVNVNLGPETLALLQRLLGGKS